MDIYAHNILDHYKNPRNKGVLNEADASCRSLNSSCGDEVTVFVKMKGEKMDKISFEGHGCAVAMAGMSILSEALIGKTVAEIMTMDLSDVQKYLGINISPRRHKCALIGLQSLQGALKARTENKR
ncbi:MAG: iron-sulfur cluster assembly scaffold protein [Patescibacteria group bacterium]|jgi:nitrogen fixation NifU-like protein|nr:iron-sulfur cluster assembly scaffold protein [Patescibacteria group bacterium]